MQPPEKLLYSRRDAAHVLSISIRSLDYLVEYGRLPSRRIGRKVLIPASALARYARGDHAEAIRSSPGTTSPS
jgi:excisionase family DNA binding protein